MLYEFIFEPALRLRQHRRKVGFGSIATPVKPSQSPAMSVESGSIMSCCKATCRTVPQSELHGDFTYVPISRNRFNPFSRVVRSPVFLEAIDEETINRAGNDTRPWGNQIS